MSSAPPDDGPPPAHIKFDAERIQDVVPKDEPLSKIGNKSSYVVHGKTYHVQSQRGNFTQVGTASWYGKKFHGRYTSSGELYDMFSVTAAHKNLPLPSYARVTNLTNKKSIIVRINDRGPFHANRILDLSYAAALKLGMLGRGTAPVKLETIDTAPPPPPKPLLLAKKQPTITKTIMHHAATKHAQQPLRVAKAKTRATSANQANHTG